MNIACFSDTHRCVDELDVAGADVAICAGDFCNTGSLEDVIVFNAWFSRLPCEHKIVVAGNHDVCFEKEPSLARSMLDESIIYLQDDGVEIDGVTFYGSPWQLPFMNWAFNLPEEELRKKFERIPGGVDVLITHSPPFGILDSTPDKTHFGSKSLLDKVREVKPKYHIFGHIHDGYGRHVDHERDITFVNVSLLDEAYAFVNRPMFVEL